MINSKLHGIIDYLLIIFLLVGPGIFHLESSTSIITYILAGIHFALTICTNFEYGAVRFIPFKIHGKVELGVSLALVGLAFYLGGMDGEASRNFYIGLAIAVFVIWALTDYKSSHTKQEIPDISSNIDGDMI